MANVVIGKNIILYKLDTSVIPYVETPFACSTNATFNVQADTLQIASSTNAWFDSSKINLSTWAMSCDGLITLSNYSYKSMLESQKNRELLLLKFTIEDGVTTQYVSGYANISSVDLIANYKEAGNYSVTLQGSGQFGLNIVPTTTTSTTSTTSTSTTTSTTSTTTTSTSTTTSTTSTSTSTSTSTTTLGTEWYYLYNCTTGAIITSTNYVQGTFTLNQTVTSPVTPSVFYYISSITNTNPAGTLYPIISYGGTGCPATTTTSTTSTTSTTTAIDWYYLYDCTTGATVTSTNYAIGTFAVNQRVYSPATSKYYYVLSVTNTYPAGNLYPIVDGGGTGCPATTSTTTTLPPLTLSLTVFCDNVGTYLGKVVASWSGGSGSGYQIRAGYAFSYSTYRAMGTTQTLTLTSETNPYDGASGLRNTTGGSDLFAVQVIDDFGNSNTLTTAINCVYPTTSTTTSTTSTTTAIDWYYLYDCTTGDTVTSTNYAVGTFSVNQTVYSPVTGRYYYILSITNTYPAGTLYPIMDAGGTGCPATTTTSTTTTLAPVNFDISSVCDGVYQDVTINNFTGGNGSYQASVTTYDTASAAIGGTFSAVSLSRVYDNQSGNTDRYVAVKDSAGFGLVVKFVNSNCTTTTTTSTTTTTTTTTTTEATFNYRYSAYRCATGSTVYIVSAVTLSEGGTYSIAASGQAECYSQVTFIETTPDTPTTYYFVSSGDDCGNTSRCIEA